MRWKTLLIVLFLPTTYYLLHTTPAKAASNDSYNLQIQSVDTDNNQPTPTPLSPQSQVQAGFVNQTDNSLSISLENEVIDFGQLIPTNPISRKNKITLLNNSAFGASVQALEDHPLKDSSSQNSIPDTTCDNGSCNNESASPWTGTLT